MPSFPLELRPLTMRSSACIAAAIRISYSVKLLHNRDILYHSAPVGVWIQCEITAGFLILGIPTLPKIFKNSGLAQHCVSLVRSWTTRSSSKDKPSSNNQNVSWYRNASRKTPRKEKGWSDLELTGRTSSDVDAQSMRFGYAVSGDEGHSLSHGVIPPGSVHYVPDGDRHS
jgi:hypothetical protein